LPLKVYKRGENNERERVLDHPLADLLSRPAHRCGPVHLKQWLILPLLVHGNSLVVKFRPEPGAAPSALLPLDWPSIDARALLAQLREDITDLYAGPENSGRPAILPPGLEWNAIGHTAAEAELSKQRYVTREEIQTVFDLPGPLLGDLRHGTYSNVEELHKQL